MPNPHNINLGQLDTLNTIHDQLSDLLLSLSFEQLTQLAKAVSDMMLLKMEIKDSQQGD